MKGADVVTLWWDDERGRGELVIEHDGDVACRELTLDCIADALRHPFLYVTFAARLPQLEQEVG